jgi:hypothetical protein
MGDRRGPISRKRDRFGFDGRNWPSWKRWRYNRCQRLRIAMDVGFPNTEHEKIIAACAYHEKESYRLLDGARKRIFQNLRMRDPGFGNSRIRI